MNDVAAVLEDLKRREQIFHRPEFGITRADFEDLMVDDYWEIGASGQRYDRSFILEELERRRAEGYEENWETSDFDIRQLSEDVFLLTYALLQNKTRRTWRVTVWMRTTQGWKILYHQGTVISS
jgi:hypothetical protein